MTEKERQEIIELVHNTIHGFFEDAEFDSRPFTKEETLLLEVNKAICEKIKEMPTVERPHGEWVESRERKGHFYCSECVQEDAAGKWRELFDYKYNFCPNCGADMKEGDDK